MRCYVSPKLGLVLLLLLPLPFGCRDWDPVANSPKQPPTTSPKPSPQSPDPSGSSTPNNNPDPVEDRNAELSYKFKLYLEKVERYKVALNKNSKEPEKAALQELEAASKDWMSERKQLDEDRKDQMQRCPGLREISEAIDQRAQAIQERLTVPAAGNSSGLQAGQPEDQKNQTKPLNDKVYLQNSQIELTTLLQVETLVDEGCSGIGSRSPEQLNDVGHRGNPIGWLITTILLAIIGCCFYVILKQRQLLAKRQTEITSLKTAITSLETSINEGRNEHKRVVEKYRRKQSQNPRLETSGQKNQPPDPNISSDLSSNVPNDAQGRLSGSSNHPVYSPGYPGGQPTGNRGQSFSLENRFNQRDAGLSRSAIKVRVDENSINRRWGGEKADILLEAGNGHYLIVEGGRLIPKLNFKLNEGNIKTLRAIFQWNDETIENINVNDLEIYLEEAAYVSSYDSNHWKLEKPGVIRWNMR